MPTDRNARSQVKISSGLALTGAIAASYIGVSFLVNFWDHPYILGKSWGSIALMILTWMTFTYGPIFIGYIFWNGAGWFRRPWLPHLLLLPALYAYALLADNLMLWAFGAPDWDGTMGAPIMPGFLLMLLMIVIYYLGLAAKSLLSFRERSRTVCTSRQAPL